MSEIFFTSDLHLGHNKPFLYKPRGFQSIEDHDATIVKNWNDVVNPDDTVFILGDLIVGDNREGSIEKLNQLNGKLVFCRGNHDTDSKTFDYIDKCNKIDCSIAGNGAYANIIKIGKWSFYICHYPTMIGDFNFIKPGHKKFCLHGHTHSDDKFQFLQYCCYNVALNAHGNRPVNVKDIQKDLIEAMHNLHLEKAKKGNN